jgi:hypothetical protein
MRHATRSIRLRAVALGAFALSSLFDGGRAEGEGRPWNTATAGLTVNGIAAPFDLDETPRFGWHVSSAEPTAYEIRVSSTRELARSARGDVWTSGKVASNQQNDVRYEGPALDPAERYSPKRATRPWRASAPAATGSVQRPTAPHMQRAVRRVQQPSAGTPHGLRRVTAAKRCPPPRSAARSLERSEALTPAYPPSSPPRAAR